MTSFLTSLLWYSYDCYDVPNSKCGLYAVLKILSYSLTPVQTILTSCSELWVGLAGEGAGMGSWLGSQQAGWVIGNGRKAHAAPKLPSAEGRASGSEVGPGDTPRKAVFCNGAKFHAERYGTTWGTVGQSVAMRVDMTKRECSFKVSLFYIGKKELPKAGLLRSVVVRMLAFMF